MKTNTSNIKPFKISADGRDVITIGGFSFTFLAEQCFWQIAGHSRELYCQITAHTRYVEEAEKAKLIEYPYEPLEKGDIQFSFECPGIYTKGIPTGAFSFEEGKTGSPFHIHFKKDGVDSDLEFFGRVEMRDGWLGINGYFEPGYEIEPVFPVTVYKKLETKNIDWSQYQFSLEEARQADPNAVQYLSIIEHLKKEFPREILTFVNLKDMAIGHKYEWKSNVTLLEEIPKEIDQLGKLTVLTINHTSIRNLPDSIGHLYQLNYLDLSDNNLTELPEKVFHLPRLKNLQVENNELSTIPAHIHLPELQEVNLENNKLKTLPKTLALQPKLKRLVLKKNPWDHLPESYGAVKKIELGLQEKKRLFNHDYPGVDSKKAKPWSNDIYYARHDSALHSVFLNAIDGTILEKYQKSLEILALKSVCITTIKKDDYSVAGNTRFGGLPDLPVGETCPVWEYDYRGIPTTSHYFFIAQLNCEELASYQDYLPRKGMLYFYLQEQEGMGCKVVYVPNADNLQSASNIDSDEISLFENDRPFHPFKVEFSSFVALPVFYNDEYWIQWAKAPELQNLRWDGKDGEVFEAQNGAIRKKLGETELFHSINDYAFAQNESPQEQAALKLKGDPEDWMILLKADSDVDCNFCFGDAGQLFFVIHKSDLAKCDFHNVFAVIETS